MVDQQDRESRKRQIASLRFTWLEAVVRDPSVRNAPIALALAFYVFKRFRWDLGYAEFSLQGAAKWLCVEPRSIARARKRLVARGWIVLRDYRTNQINGWAANRYTLGGGPEDFLLEEHVANDPQDSVTDDRDDLPT